MTTNNIRTPKKQQIHSSKQISVNDLPPEMLTHVLSYLNKEQRIEVTTVCHEFNEVIRHNIGFNTITIKEKSDCLVLKDSPLLKNTKLIVNHGQMFYLEELKLSETEMGYLRGVHTIDVYKAVIDDKGILALVEGGQHIHNITLGGGTTDISLKALKSVHTIDICGCRNITIEGIKALKDVHEITLSKPEPGWLEQLGNVHKVCLYPGSVIGEDQAKSLIKTKHLALHYTKIKENVFIHLTNLECIEITSSMTSDSGLKHLVNLTKLKLNDCLEVTGSCFEHLVKLKHVTLKSCWKLDSCSLQHLTNVDHLNLIMSPVKDMGLQHLGHLKRLTLSRCGYINGPGLLYLVNLEYLNLRHCEMVLPGHLKHLTSLQYLEVSQNEAKVFKKQAEELGAVLFVTYSDDNIYSF